MVDARGEKASLLNYEVLRDFNTCMYCACIECNHLMYCLLLILTPALRCLECRPELTACTACRM